MPENLLAVDAAVGAGLHPDFSSAKTHDAYDELYEGVYKKMYGRLKPLYERMRNLS